MHIEEICSMAVSGPPLSTVGGDKITRLIPVPDRDILRVRYIDLSLERSQLRRIEGLVSDVAKLLSEVRASDRRDLRSGFTEDRVEHGNGGIVEPTPRACRIAHTLNLIKWRIAGSDGSDRASGHSHAVVNRQVFRSLERLKVLDHVRRRRVALRLDIDEEIERLARGRVVNALLGPYVHPSGNCCSGFDDG